MKFVHQLNEVKKKQILIIGRVTADMRRAEGKRRGERLSQRELTCRINEPHMGSDHLRLVMNTRPRITLIFFLIWPLLRKFLIQAWEKRSRSEA
jgi:hypothetical protein